MGVKDLLRKIFVREEVEVVQEATVQGSNNDRLIMLSGAGMDDIRRYLVSFLDAHSQEHPTRVINLVRASDTHSAICFPKGISFDTFCFITAYLSGTVPSAAAWTTIANADSRILPQHTGTGIMLRAPAAIASAPAVDIATQDGKAYTFSIGAHSMQERPVPAFAYVPPPVSMEQLHTLPTIRV